MPVQRCKLKSYVLPCFTPEGLEAAAVWFGLSEPAVAHRAGRYTRGEHVGAPRGWIYVVECTEGGWHHGMQTVLKPRCKFASFFKTYDEVGRAKMNPFSGGQNTIGWDGVHGACRSPAQLRTDIEYIGIPAVGLTDDEVLELWAQFMPAELPVYIRRQDGQGYDINIIRAGPDCKR